MDSVCKALGHGEAIHVSKASDVQISNNVVKNFYKEGINIVGESNDIFVFGNLVGELVINAKYNCTNGTGIGVDAWESPRDETYNIQIYENVIFGCGSGINVRGEQGGHLDDVWITNNVVSTVGNAFNMYGTSSEAANADPNLRNGDRTNVKVLNNTFVGLDNTSRGDQFVCNVRRRVYPGETIADSFERIDGFEFKNNIVAREYDTDLPKPLFYMFNQTSLSSDTSSPITYEFTHNLYWDNDLPPTASGVHGESNEVDVDPVFVGAAITVGNQSYTTDYGINHTSSGANDEGTSLPPSAPNDDIQGHNRPYGTTHDIGAFEDH